MLSTVLIGTGIFILVLGYFKLSEYQGSGMLMSMFVLPASLIFIVPGLILRGGKASLVDALKAKTVRRSEFLIRPWILLLGLVALLVYVSAAFYFNN